MAGNISVNIPWDGWKATGVLGHGAFGRVYRIERNVYGINEKAAMKIIQIPNDPEVVEDLYSSGYDEESVSQWCRTRRDDIQKEYALMTRLKGHTNIISCDDISVVEHEDDPGYDIYIRMELLTPLQKVLKTKELSESDVIKIGMDICRALLVCEKYNIIHRDIKPQNILVNDTGDYKLGDFGVARTMEHTTNATVAGTENYMAPEIIRREKYGANVDTYSLGLVLYWLLNKRTMPFLPIGTVPQINELESARYRRISGEALPEPATGSQGLKSIVMNACRYSRDDRYSNASEMLNDLSALSANKQRLSAVGSDFEDDDSTVGLFGWNHSTEESTVTMREPGSATGAKKKPSASNNPSKKADKPKSGNKPNSVNNQAKDPSEKQKKNRTTENASVNAAAAKSAVKYNDSKDKKWFIAYTVAVAIFLLYVFTKSGLLQLDPKVDGNIMTYIGFAIIPAGYLMLFLPKIPYLSALLSIASGFLLGFGSPIFILSIIFGDDFLNNSIWESDSTIFMIIVLILAFIDFCWGIYCCTVTYGLFDERHPDKEEKGK